MDKRATRETSRGRVSWMVWLDRELRDWLKAAAEKDFRGNSTMYLEHLLRREKAKDKCS